MTRFVTSLFRHVSPRIGYSLHRVGLPIALAFGLLLCACDKAPSPIRPDPPKSRAYFRDHPQEAIQTATDCNRLMENQLSTLSPQQLEAWRGTTQGINCTNSSDVAATLTYNAYEKRLKNAADNFDANIPKKSKR